MVVGENGLEFSVEMNFQTSWTCNPRENFDPEAFPQRLKPV